jgi:hypothetical protein
MSPAIGAGPLRSPEALLDVLGEVRNALLASLGELVSDTPDLLQDTSDLPVLEAVPATCD